MKKEILESLLKKYNKQYIKVVNKLDIETADTMSSKEFRILFDLSDDSVLIEDIITKDNIHLYYEFMDDEDIEKYQSILYIIFTHRYKDVRQFLIKVGLVFNTLEGMDADILHNNYNSREIPSHGYYEISYFGIKDTLKPTDKYIAEIKASDAYKNFYAKNYVKDKVSKCCGSKVNVAGINMYVCGMCLEEISISEVNTPTLHKATEDL